MAVLMWCLSLAFMAFVAWAVGRPQPQRLQPAPVLTAPAPAPDVRPASRAAIQTSAALLAIALALDVSGPAHAFTPVETGGVYSALAEDVYVLPDATFEAAWTPVELAPDWAFKAISTSDGWLI